MFIILGKTQIKLGTECLLRIQGRLLPSDLRVEDRMGTEQEDTAVLGCSVPNFEGSPCPELLLGRAASGTAAPSAPWGVGLGFLWSVLLLSGRSQTLSGMWWDPSHSCQMLWYAQAQEKFSLPFDMPRYSSSPGAE